MSLTPTEYFQRNFWVGASFLRPSESAAALRGRRRPHHVGRRLPALRRQLPVHDRGAARRVRRRARRPRRSRCSRRPRPTCTASTSPALREIGDRVGPTVAEVAGAARPGRLSRRLDVQRVRPRASDQGLVDGGATDGTIRYGARPPEQQRNREVEATTAKIWSTAVTVVWETDLDVIRAVLPPPLEPSEPLARIRFATVDMGTGIPVFGAGWFGVRARHGKRRGRVPAVHADDHRAGDDRRARDLRRAQEDRRRWRSTSTATTMHAHASSAWASRSPRCTARSATPIEIPPQRQGRLLLQVQPVARRQGLRHRARARARAPPRRSARRPRDRRHAHAQRVAARPDRRHPGRARSCRCSSREVATTQDGEVVERVPADWLLPYVHQRYDDLSVLGKKD